MDFDTLFNQATGNAPFPYQRVFATGETLPQLINVPTGAGKTATIILGWLWRRCFADEAMRKATPRRLVYCLPMRVLVEQTVEAAERWLSNLLLQDKIHVHILMGGEEAEDWDVHPERDAILIGTQDMLLSRALNRGYGMSRYRWPMHFGLLNNDCLWVLDEIQLMGSGLATTTQLQAFREKLGVWGPVQTIWMSATLQPDWLKTVDFKNKVLSLSCLTLKDRDRENKRLEERLQAKKPILKADVSAEDTVKLVECIRSEHQRRKGLTLVVINTVDRARDLYDALRKADGRSTKKKGQKERATTDKAAPNVSEPEALLLYSRFRPVERQVQMQHLRSPVPETGRIVVATQVIEAGVDISAKTLFTELAPWPSLVQRFGRCNRFGEYGDAQVFWIDVPTGKKSQALPYDDKELGAARNTLESLDPPDVGLSSLEKYSKKENLFPYDPIHVVRQHDLHGLFSTEPDLAGGFTDISAFVRDRERNADVYVFWRQFEGNKPGQDQPLIDRDELCPVPFYDLQSFLGDKDNAWEWNGETAEWERRRAKDIRPGMTLLLHVDQGGYHKESGWTGRLHDKPSIYEVGEEEQEGLKSEPASQAGWLSVPNHLRDVEAEAGQAVKELNLHNSPEGKAVVQAARWHDVGKCHERWQDPIKEHAPEGECGPWAKFRGVRSFRPGLRHEAASALAAWQRWREKHDGWTALAVYLVAAHHGKVRTVLRSTDSGNDVFGIKPGDVLPSLPGWLSAELQVDLKPKTFGAVGTWDDAQNTFTLAAPSWVSMVAELLGPELPGDPVPCGAIPQGEPRSLGPFLLAFLETLVRVADARASRTPGKRKNA